MTKRSKAGAILALLLVLAGAVFVGRSERFRDWRPWKKAKAAEPRTAKVEKGDLEIHFKEVGELAPKLDLQVRPPVDGQVKSVGVEEGDAVKKGAVLAVIQPGKTEAEQKLYLPTAVRSPIEGVVTYLHTNEGDTVTAGKDGFIQVADLRRMIVKLEIGEVDVLKLKSGQDASVTVDALPGETFAGKITFISPGVIQKQEGGGWRQSTSKKFLVKVDIEKSDPRLRPGMTARIDILLEKHVGVLKVPLGGVFEDMGEARAYVKGASIEERIVKLGVRNEDQAVVLEGLKVGETVLLEKPEDDKVSKKAQRKP